MKWVSLTGYVSICLKPWSSHWWLMIDTIYAIIGWKHAELGNSARHPFQPCLSFPLQVLTKKSTFLGKEALIQWEDLVCIRLKQYSILLLLWDSETGHDGSRAQGFQNNSPFFSNNNDVSLWNMETNNEQDDRWKEGEWQIMFRTVCWELGKEQHTGLIKTVKE